VHDVLYKCILLVPYHTMVWYGTSSIHLYKTSCTSQQTCFYSSSR